MKLNYKLILFDLDGTLIDSNPGVKTSLIYTLKRLGYAVPPQIDMPHTYMGPPLMDTFEKLFGMPYETALIAADIYKEHMSKDNKYKNVCFEEIKDVLTELKLHGAVLGVATTKYEPFAEKILKDLGIYKFFDVVCGSNSDGTVKEKFQVIKLALKRLNSEADKNTVLIGDSKYDTEGAVKAGIEFIGVNYGYGLQKDMIELGAKIFADSPKDLLSLLLR